MTINIGAHVAQRHESRTAQSKIQCPRDHCDGNLAFVGTDIQTGVLIYACDRRGCTIRILNSYLR